MILMQGKNLTKSFGIDIIFENIDFAIKEGEKVGVLGPNGAGKTTFFRCLTGEENLDSGEIMIGNKYTIGYLEQIPQFSPQTTVMDAVMEMYQDIFILREDITMLEEEMGKTKNNKKLEKIMENYSQLTHEYEERGGFSCETNARRIIKGLGFTEEDFFRKVNKFSGGEKTKVSLARLLAKEPDLLLLDEPTNHLDLQALEWLESYLKAYQGAVLLISHDRYFLDNVVTRILELKNKNMRSFPGNYSKYMVLKEEQDLAYQRMYEKQQKEIAKTEEFIQRYKAGVKAKQARGREKQLNRLAKLDKLADEQTIFLDFSSIPDSGEIVLNIDNLAMAFGEKTLFNRIDLQIRKGEKVGLIGGNGTGKSTLLKIIVGKLQAIEGEFHLGSRVKVGYFDQEHKDLDEDKSVLEEICDTFNMGEKEARNKLAPILFQGDDVFKLIRELSGGEKGRLSFLKLILRNPNFLILDEPTNHLDLDSKEIVENLLMNFPGTIFVVSHDRYFLDRVVNRILELENETVTNYLGNYSYFKGKKEQLNKKEKEVELKSSKEEIKKEKPKINKSKLKEQIGILEEEISFLEKEIEVLSISLANPEIYQDEKKSKETVQQYNEAEKKLPLLLEEWEKLLLVLEEN